MDNAELFASMDQSRIEDYVRTQQEEHLLLDFKTISRSDLSSPDDRRNLAKALSGFANSSGGLIVWGVAARKIRPDGPDCASSTQEIDDLQTFISRLNEFTGSFVRPIVEGVQHRAIDVGGNRGFAVSLIPESVVGPHMALGGEGRYFKRSGSSFYPMEHFDIEDMFGRRRKPRLESEFIVAPHGSSRTGSMVEHKNAIGLFITNTGRGSAKNIFARVTVSKPYWIGESGPQPDGRGGLRRLSGDGVRSASIGGDSNLVVHPGMRQGLVAIAFNYDMANPELPDLEATLELAADDMPLAKTHHALPWASILTAIKNV